MFREYSLPPHLFCQRPHFFAGHLLFLHPYSTVAEDPFPASPTATVTVGAVNYLIFPLSIHVWKPKRQVYMVIVICYKIKLSWVE